MARTAMNRLAVPFSGYPGVSRFQRLVIALPHGNALGIRRSSAATSLPEENHPRHSSLLAPFVRSLLR